jgi:hypothetical protein
MTGRQQPFAQTVFGGTDHVHVLTAARDPHGARRRRRRRAAVARRWRRAPRAEEHARLTRVPARLVLIAVMDDGLQAVGVTGL